MDTLKTLIQWCEINTGSTNIEGINRFKSIITKLFLETLDCEHQALSNEVLSFRKRPSAKTQVLLNIHLDTVFSLTHPFQTVTQIDENTLQGPGVCDAKGGILVILQGLMHYESSDIKDKIGWEVLLNTDEEIGSLLSKDILMEVAKTKDYGFIFEPPLPDGTLISSRKGSAVFSLQSNGISAHVGRDFDKGNNAIINLLNIIQTIQKLNMPDTVIFNIGTIQGGTVVNQVPDFASCEINIRGDKNEDIQTLLDAIETLTKQQDNITYTLKTYRPPKIFNKQTEHLFNHLKTIAKKSDIAIKWQASGGVCDGNFLAAAGLATIDTLGPLGGNMHTDKEYVIIESISQKAHLLNQLLQSL